MSGPQGPSPGVRRGSKQKTNKAPRGGAGEAQQPPWTAIAKVPAEDTYFPTDLEKAALEECAERAITSGS